MKLSKFKDSRFKTFSDFENIEDFEAYMTKEIIAKVFKKYSKEEMVLRNRYSWRSHFPYEIKLYQNHNILLRFELTKEEYDIAPYSYNRPLASTELKNIPMDILLSLNGFDELNVVDKGYQSVHRKVIAIGNCKVIMAWLLKSKNFMTYSKFSNNTFIEDYIRIDDKTLDEAEKDYEKIMNFYHYGFNVKEM